MIKNQHRAVVSNFEIQGLRVFAVVFAGALKFWQQRSQADFRAAEEAVWGDEAVDAAPRSADSWLQGLPFVRSLAGLWKFHLASCPEQVPEHFFSLGFDDGSWGSLPGAKPFFSFWNILLFEHLVV